MKTIMPRVTGPWAKSRGVEPAFLAYEGAKITSGSVRLSSARSAAAVLAYIDSLPLPPFFFPFSSIRQGAYPRLGKI